MKGSLRANGLFLAAGILLGACPIHAAADDGTKSEQDIKCLVNQLGSKRFKEREAAALELSHLGKAALASLQEAALSHDAELRRRAQQLVERLEPPASPLKPNPPPKISVKSYL